MSYQAIYDRLMSALKKGPYEQIALVQTMEEVYAFLEESDPLLSDEQILSLRILLKQGETQVGRYYGM